jgi:hypothetical protein
LKSTAKARSTKKLSIAPNLSTTRTQKWVVLECTLPENQVLFPEAFRSGLDTPPQKTALQTHQHSAMCYVNICAKNSTITSIILRLVHPVKTYLGKVILSKNQCDKSFAIPMRLFWHNDC